MTSFLISNWQNNPKQEIRTAFGRTIVDLAHKHKNIVALCADLISSTKLDEFSQQFPDRFWQVGVAEQNMAGMAAGLAIVGKIPFMASFATFCPGRCLDQIRVQICINNLNVKIIGSHAGLSHPQDGVTAQATEDIAIMRSMPNMTVLVPSDYNQTIQAVKSAYEYSGPVYIRLAREPTAVFMNKNQPWQIGKAQVLKKGSDITLISAGPLLAEALIAADQASQTGISCEVINLHTIKPIDAITLYQSAKKTNKVVTIEDHQIQGGIGSAVAEALSLACPTKIKMIGLDNHFSRSAASYQELLATYHLAADSILRIVKRMVRD